MSSQEIFEETKRIRPDLKLVLTSAYGKETVDASCAGLQIEHYIRKPFLVDDLVKLASEHPVRVNERCVATIRMSDISSALAKEIPGGWLATRTGLGTGSMRRRWCHKNRMNERRWSETSQLAHLAPLLFHVLKEWV
jgi:hypothetical protein